MGESWIMGELITEMQVAWKNGLHPLLKPSCWRQLLEDSAIASFGTRLGELPGSKDVLCPEAANSGSGAAGRRLSDDEVRAGKAVAQDIDLLGNQ